MKKGSRANKGQFSVIAALLVSVIMVSAVISSYAMVRHSTIQDSPKVLSAIGEMNSGIKSILDFTVGYYGSILQVTGNSTYARELTTSYLSSGLVNIARSHPEWNPSFTLDSDYVSTNWFMPDSYSTGEISVTYSLDALGIEGISYETFSSLSVSILEAGLGEAQINVTRDNSEPELGLTKENFWFYNYSYTDSTWELVNPTSVIISSNGVYTMPIPSGVSQDSYSVQIEDNRGIMVSAFYSQASVASESKIPHFTYTFDWASTGVLDIYETLSTDTFVIELLQNGTLKWLSQNLELTPAARPIPPVSVKAFRVNATISGVNQEVPFQVEDWASNYMVPLGLAGNDSIFNNNNMLVFLVNNEISEITLWWNGNDTATQTPYAWQNVYFNDNPSSGTLENGFLHLDINNFYVDSRVIGEFTTYQTDFLRINGEMPMYGAEPAYIIYNGVVRDLVEQEPEYGGSGVPGCPNFYSQAYITLPANTPYYTYATRTIFVNSSLPRTINELSAIQISVSSGSPMTEDGTSGGYPVSSSSTGLFYDGFPTGWDHHWSQIVSGADGAGFMFTDADNQDLYVFDEGGTKRGALNIQSNDIEVNPVDSSLSSVSFTNSRDLTWYGAVVTFNSEPVYRSGDDVGLWVMVENPPIVSLDQFLSEFDLSHDYVDNNNSNMDSSADKGSHSTFSAQKAGPDLVNDTLTEENTGGSSSVTLINAESFEGTWPPTGWTEDPDPNNWNAESNRAYDGSRSADFDGSGSGVSGSLVTCDLDCSDATSISVEFRFYDERLDPNEFILEYFDGTSWDVIDNLAGYAEWTWNLYEDEITDSQYFISDFKIRWRAYDVEGGGGPNNEHAYVDMVTVTKQTSGPTNYELDLEVQWTSADFDETNEELCIYVGEVAAENLQVDVWTGSGWDTLIGALNVGWNNATVTSYLTSSTFTIRFIGTTETGDTTQDYWTIDATLLHTWS